MIEGVGDAVSLHGDSSGDGLQGKKKLRLHVVLVVALVLVPLPLDVVVIVGARVVLALETDVYVVVEYSLQPKNSPGVRHVVEVMV